MAIIKFSKPEQDILVKKIQDYFVKELDQKLGYFEASFLLNFLAEEVGPFFYNKAVQDAQAILKKRIDDIAGAIDALEKPTGGKR